MKRVKGSGVWWICYYSGDVKRREKIGTKSDAVKAYQDRKTAIRRGEKLPANSRERGIRFAEIGEDAIAWYTRNHKKDLRTFTGRMITIINGRLGKLPAAKIDHNDIENWIDEQARAKVKRMVRRDKKNVEIEVKNDWSPATKNRYRTTFPVPTLWPSMQRRYPRTPLGWSRTSRRITRKCVI